MTKQSTWLDPHQAADYLGLKSEYSWKTVKLWARQGKLRYGLAGNRVRFRIEDLDAFLNRRGKNGVKAHG